MPYEKTENGYLLSNDKNRLQIGVIHGFLSSDTYWAKGIAIETVEAYIKNSDCFGIYSGSRQVGFARLITDGVIFGYLADVFILPEYRGRGLSKQLMLFMLNYEPYKKLKKIMLRSTNARGLYAQLGFKPPSDPENLMELKPFEVFRD